jgi:hypothetical protein
VDHSNSQTFTRENARLSFRFVRFSALLGRGNWISTWLKRCTRSPFCSFDGIGRNILMSTRGLEFRSGRRRGGRYPGQGSLRRPHEMLKSSDVADEVHSLSLAI